MLSIFTISIPVLASYNDFQGFEDNTGDWVASQAITRVPSGGGSLALTAASGSYYAELENLQDGYMAGYGDGGYSLYGGSNTTYLGDFFQAIDVYVDAGWAAPVPSYADSFWIDMTPYHADPANYGAEHNFRLTATGTSVIVKVDGQTTPMATIVTSGWYTFMMTYQKAALDTDPVITDMQIYDSSSVLVGTTTVAANSPGGPFLSSDLRGNGYVWITVWTNGSANDILGIDNVRTGLLENVDGAKKLALAPAPSNSTLPGGGFAVINNGVGSDFNLELTVALKGAAANTTYEVWLENDGQPAFGSPVGTFTTNKQGNGTFHINMFIAPGIYNFGVDVAIGGGDQYVTSNVYGTAILTTFLPLS
jgi:hypothetical protein